MVFESGLVSLAIIAGIATFFSPCVYALLPAYLGYFAHDAGTAPSTGGAIRRGVAAAMGSILAFALLGLVAISIGEQLRGIFPALEVGVGLVLIAAGGVLVAGRYPSVTIRLPAIDGSTGGFVAFGAGYAVAGAGCVAPVFFSITVAAAGAPLGAGIIVMAAYALTFATMLIGAALVAAAGIDLVTDRSTSLGRRLPQVAGMVILLAGVVQVAIGLGWDPPVL